MLGFLQKKFKNVPITVKVSVAYAICSILQKCLSFITLPLFTRLLTTTQYGQYSIYISWSSIITIFITLNLAYGSFSTAMVKYEDRRDQYISSIQGLCTILTIIFLGIYFLFREQLNVLLELPTPIIFIMAIEILANFSIACWSGKKRFEFKYKSVIVITLFISFSSPILAYYFVINSDEKGYARLLGYAVVAIIVGFILYIINFSRGKVFFHREFWKYALNFNVPLIAYYLSQTVFTQSDRIMISHLVGTDKAGIYGVAFSLAMILNFILNAINNSYVPWLYGKIKHGQEKDNAAVSCGIAILMGVMLLGVIALAPEIILIMAGKNYYEAIWVVPPIAASVLLLFYSQLFINVEFYFEEKRYLVYGSIGAAVLNVCLNAIVIPLFGYYAAGYSTFFSYLVFAGSNYWCMRKVLLKNNKKLSLYSTKGLLYILTIFIICAVIMMSLYPYAIARYAVMCVGLVISIFQRKKVKLLYAIIKEK